MLDVATGSGNAAIAAARRGCEAVGVDYVPALLERGRRRAEAEHLDVGFVEGDAEELRSPTPSFDAVLSIYGVMFAPDHRRAAAELARVCRPGGRIALASWTPDGFIGEMLKVVAGHVPPPAGVASPLLWGAEGVPERAARRRDQRARLHASGRSRSASARPRRTSTTSARTTARP